jgi:hypothetical protein
MREQLGRDGTNIALLGKVSFAQRVISNGYVWQKDHLLQLLRYEPDYGLRPTEAKPMH